MGKIKLVIDDEETRRIWNSAQKAAKRVQAWPAWKRGSTDELDNDIEAAYKIYKNYRDRGLIVSEVAARFYPKNFGALEDRYQREHNGKES